MSLWQLQTHRSLYVLPVSGPDSCWYRQPFSLFTMLFVSKSNLLETVSYTYIDFVSLTSFICHCYPVMPFVTVYYIWMVFAVQPITICPYSKMLCRPQRNRNYVLIMDCAIWICQSLSSSRANTALSVIGSMCLSKVIHSVGLLRHCSR